MNATRSKSSYLRYAAIGSALLLVGGFVWYRGTGRLPFAGQPVETASERAAAADPESNLEEALMSSSKSGAVFDDRAPVMSGSKSLVITSPSASGGDVDDTLMFISKSGRVAEPRDVEPPPPAQTQPDSKQAPEIPKKSP